LAFVTKNEVKIKLPKNEISILFLIGGILPGLILQS
jgi:hypothetical protein